jgi:HSP20 family protein
MKPAIQNITHSCIYPGDYVPMINPDEMQRQLNRFSLQEAVSPPVNISETEDLFTVEMAVPGVNRGDFMIQADENDLSVSVVHQESPAQAAEKFQQHEFNYNIFNRHIILPENADTEFVSAVYNSGILRLIIPKVKQLVKKLHTRIVVY